MCLPGPEFFGLYGTMLSVTCGAKRSSIACFRPRYAAPTSPRLRRLSYTLDFTQNPSLCFHKTVLRQLEFFVGSNPIAQIQNRQPTLLFVFFHKQNTRIQKHHTDNGVHTHTHTIVHFNVPQYLTICFCPPSPLMGPLFFFMAGVAVAGAWAGWLWCRPTPPGTRRTAAGRGDSACPRCLLWCGGTRSSPGNGRRPPCKVRLCS